MDCRALKPGNLVMVLLLLALPAAAWAWYCGYDNCPGTPPGADCGGQNVPCTTGPNEPFECGFIGYHCRSVNCGATNCNTYVCDIYCSNGWPDCGGKAWPCSDSRPSWGCNIPACDTAGRCSHTICEASGNSFPMCDHDETGCVTELPTCTTWPWWHPNAGSCKNNGTYDCGGGCCQQGCVHFLDDLFSECPCPFGECIDCLFGGCTSAGASCR